MARELVVVGGGGFGRELLDVVEAHNAARADHQLAVIGIVDDAPSATNLNRLSARGYDHLGSIATVLASRSPSGYVLGIGSPSVKRRLAEAFDSAGWAAVSVIHPSASLGSMGELADGSVVCGGVQLSTNTKLGRHVHLNPGAIVGHDVELGDFVSVNPGAIISGEVTVEAGVLIGAGATILQGLSVGSGAVVGAMACVTKSVAEGVTVKGVPARVE